MKSVLLDTHALLWWFTDPTALAAEVRAVINDDRNCVLVSPVSAYELAFKHRLGKLGEAEVLLESFEQRIAGQDFENLHITIRHALLAGRLDPRHRDPFDRLLIAQALVESVELVSNEELFDSFGVRRLW